MANTRVASNTAGKIIILFIPLPPVKRTITTCSLRDDLQIVEVGHRISLRPQTDFPGLGERSVLDFIELLPVQPDGEEIAFGSHAQFAPLVLGHGRLLAVGAALALDGQILALAV